MPDPLPSSPVTPVAAAPDATTLLEAAAVLGALGDPARYAILCQLAAGPALPVNDLAARLGRAPDAVSKHLRVLRDARLVRVTAPLDGDTRKQFYEVPAPFRTRDAAGRPALDFGTVVIRCG